MNLLALHGCGLPIVHEANRVLSFCFVIGMSCDFHVHDGNLFARLQFLVSEARKWATKSNIVKALAKLKESSQTPLRVTERDAVHTLQVCWFQILSRVHVCQNVGDAWRYGFIWRRHWDVGPLARLKKYAGAAAQGDGKGSASSSPQGNWKDAAAVAMAIAHRVLCCDRTHLGARLAFNQFLSRALPGCPIQAGV